MERMTTQQRSEHPSRGFTLIETTIALLVLGFGLLAVAAMQLQAMDFASRGRHQTQAAVFAQRRIEILHRQPWAALAPTNWTAPVTLNHVVNDGVDRVEHSYAVSWRISDLVNDFTRTIDVRVNWDEDGRPGREYAISSIRYNF